MREFQKIILAILLLTVITLAACSNDENQSSASGGDEIVIRLGHPGNETETDPYYTYTNKFSEVLESETDGRIKLEVFPNSQLGSIESMMGQTDSGNLDMTAGQNTGNLATYYPSIEVLDLPYAFETLEIGQAVLNGEFGDKLKEGLADSSNLRLLSFIPSSFRHFTNNVHPVTSPEDLQGLTIRVMEVPIHQEMVKALGATPTVVAFDELYSALQTGVVDGQENAPYLMIMSNIHEVTDYLTLDKHVMNTAVSLINDEFYNSLSEEDQEIVENAEAEATEAFLNHVQENEEEDLQVVEDAGVEITELSSEQFQAFQDAVIEPLSEYLDGRVEEGLVDEMLETIENES